MTLEQAEVAAFQPEPKHCLNCGEALHGPYCYQCGQKDIPVRQTLGEMLGNFISSFWSYEGKFWKTISNLLFRPGFLAREYVEGRRERYFHPARMYVFISFVFFLVVSTLGDKEQIAAANPGTNSPPERIYTYESFGLKLSLDNSYRSLAHYDSVQMTLPETARARGFSRWLSRKQVELTTRYGSNKEFQQAFDGAYSQNVSKVFFWLLPVFALLLKVFYRRSGYYYAQHLVFTVYIYDFFFLLASMLFTFGYATSLWIVADPLLYLTLLVYFVAALRRMYGGRWWLTILKAGVVIVSLLICISLGLFINLALTLALI